MTTRPRSRLAGAILLLGLLTLLSPLRPAAGDTSKAPDATAVRAAIGSRYAVLDAAVSKMDIAKFIAIFTEDATITSSGFEFPILAYRTVLANLLSTAVEASQSSEIISIDHTDTTATVMARTHFRVVTKDAGGKLQTVESIGTSRDGWRLSDNAWRLASVVETSQRMWIDGIEMGGTAPLSANQREKIVAELRNSARQLATVDPGNGFDDLAFLDQLVGDARVVGLGESSHGSSEQFRIKHRIIEYLVARKGFTVVAFEANWSASDKLDDYVKGAPGTAATAVEQLGYWVWRTEEVRRLVEWMREQNRSRGSKTPLSFTGFDIQQLDNPTRCVIDHFARLGGADLEALRQHYQIFERRGQGSGSPLSAEQFNKLLQDARENSRAALAIVDRNRQALIGATSPAEFERARQCARVILQNTGTWDALSSSAVRDQAMADNVRWLAEVAYPGQKILLWAHNSHIGAQKGLMGGYLREVFGKQWVPLGLASHHGSIRANPFKDKKVVGGLYSTEGPVAIELAPPPDGSIDDVLNSAGVPQYAVAFADVPPTGDLGKWLAEPQAETRIGWPYDPAEANRRTVVPLETYDAIVFIAETGPTVPLQ